VLVVAEGLVMYLPEKDGTALFRRITEQFPSGQIAFDGYSGSMVRLVSRLATVRGAKVELVWGVDDPHDLEKQISHLHLAESVEFLTMPKLVSRLSTNRFRGAMYQGMGRLPFYRHLIRHLRYEFVGKPTA
jgi:O-methyltransferase involved in polyketide biosynthesis